MTAPIQCFRFHPVTGIDANDIDTSGATEEQRAELAAEVRAGARFYWLKDEGGQYERVERSNFDFAIYVSTGVHPEWIDTKL